jgi:hypothetical protein
MTRRPLLVVLAVVMVTLLAAGIVGYFELAPRATNEPETTTTALGSFTFAPNGPVKIDSVWATAATQPNGTQDVTFYVTFENDGSTPVYAIGGWVGTMSSTIIGNSDVLRESPAVICPGAIYIVTLNWGQNATVYAPDCSSGFNYHLVHSGSIAVQLSFGWTTDENESMPFSNSTTIVADFNFA